MAHHRFKWVLSHAFQPIHDIASSLIAPPYQTSSITRSILRNGAIPAVLYAITAVLTNHVRRVLVPWLGQFLWWHAIENMKFARSSPHYFLKASLSFTWGQVLFWACCDTVISCTRNKIRDELVRLEAASQGAKTVGGKRPGGHGHSGRQELALDIYTTLHVSFGLATLEKYYTQACFSVAYVYAFARLVVFGNVSERAFLRDCSCENWPRAVFQWCLVVYWVYTHFLPATWQVVRATAAGKPALGGFHGILWGGTAYLVRYSNKYFILLELSDMLVTFGWMVLGVALVVSLKLQHDMPRRATTKEATGVYLGCVSEVDEWPRRAPQGD